MTSFPGRWWITVVVVVVTAILLSPFYWVLVGSFMTPAELFGVDQSLWPRHFVVENWSKALERLWPHVRNSLLGQHGNVDRHTPYHRAGRLRTCVEKARRTHRAFHVHARNADAPGNRLRDPPLHRFLQDQPREYPSWPDPGRHDFHRSLRADHALGLYEGTALRTGRGCHGGRSGSVSCVPCRRLADYASRTRHCRDF